MSVTRNPARPCAGSPAYSPDNLPVYRGGSAGGAPAPVCEITITGDIAGDLGGQPLDISGQDVSITVPASPPNFYAAGGPAATVSWSGWRVFEFAATTYSTAGNSYHTAFAINSAYTKSVQATWEEASGVWLILINSGFIGTLSGTATSTTGIAINGSSGDAELYLDAHTITKADSGYSGLGALFSGDNAQPACTFGTSSPTLSEGDQYAATFTTDHESLRSATYPSGYLDWCGNTI